MNAHTRTYINHNNNPALEANQHFTMNLAMSEQHHAQQDSKSSILESFPKMIIDSHSLTATLLLSVIIAGLIIATILITVTLAVSPNSKTGVIHDWHWGPQQHSCAFLFNMFDVVVDHQPTCHDMWAVVNVTGVVGRCIRGVKCCIVHRVTVVCGDQTTTQKNDCTNRTVIKCIVARK